MSDREQEHETLHKIFQSLGSRRSKLFYGTPAVVLLAGVHLLDIGAEWWTPVLLVYAIVALADMFGYGFQAAISLPMILVLLTTFVSSPAMAQTVVEQRLAQLQLCSSLKTENNILGQPVTIGINKLKSVTLTRAEAVMVGNGVTLNFTGGLACRTSDSAVIKGDASVDLLVSAVVDLANCSIQSLSITATKFGGTFRQILEGAWQSLIKPKLETEATRMIKEACTGFVTAN